MSRRAVRREHERVPFAACNSYRARAAKSTARNQMHALVLVGEHAVAVGHRMSGLPAHTDTAVGEQRDILKVTARD